jgi:hypothetical protein
MNRRASAAIALRAHRQRCRHERRHDDKASRETYCGRSLAQETAVCRVRSSPAKPGDAPNPLVSSSAMYRARTAR